MENALTNTLLLEERINQSGYKRSFIANKMGISSYTLSKKTNNENEFLASEINILCELLKINVNDRMKIFFAK